MSNTDLLKELRIERDQRDAHDTRGSRWPWIAGAVVLLLALIGAGAW